jgi:transcription factor IIIB subunit 2
VLSPVVLQEVLRTARALYDFPTLGSYASNGSSAGATACALLLLALEAHASPPRSAPHALVLAAQLGAALGTRETMVMARYRMLIDTIEAGAARVPWLADARATRSKRISRRSWVAKAVLDVLQFRNELERAEIADRGGPIGLDIEGEADGCVIEGEDQAENEAALDTLIAKVELNMADSTGAASYVPEATHAAGPVRKHKKSRTTTGQATCFLLDPLARLAPAHTTLAHTAYLLSSDAATESAVLPTRLQLLAVERGNTEAIHDEELFSDGELEGIVIGTDEQTVEERGRRAQALRMIWGEDDAEVTRAGSGVETSEKHGRKSGKERIDMDKLAALLDSDDSFAALGVEDAKLAEGEETGDEDAELITEDARRSSGDWQV